MASPKNLTPIIIVGGGVSGLEIATTLGRRWRRRHDGRGPHITLIDRDSAHVWKPMLHTIAAGTRDISEQQISYIAQAYESGFDYQPGELSSIDRAKKEVVIAALYAADGRLLIPERRLTYSKLIIAVGSQANDFGTPGVAEHCYMIDSRRQADGFNQELRLRLLQTITQNIPLDIAIVGGGATGVELAAELIQLVETSIAYGATGLKERISVTLIESSPRLLAAFPENISDETKTRLQSIGIKVLTDTKVNAATAEGLELADGQKLNASLMVWAAGVKAPAFLATLNGLETNRANQLVVLPTLQTSRDTDIYAIGDCSSLTLPNAARPLPPTAQVAHQQARYIIRNLPRALEQQTNCPGFKYQDFGSLVSLSTYDAFGSLGKFGLLKGGTIHGRLAQLSHAMLYRSHQARLFGFWRGSLVWLVDCLNSRLRAKIRLD